MCYRKNVDHKNQFSHPGDIDYPIFPSNFCKDVLYTDISLILCKYIGYSEYLNLLCMCKESYKVFNNSYYILNFVSKYYLEDTINIYRNKIENDEETLKTMLYMLRINKFTHEIEIDLYYDPLICNPFRKEISESSDPNYIFLNFNDVEYEYPDGYDEIIAYVMKNELKKRKALCEYKYLLVGAMYYIFIY